jgi:hypothetical protein
MIGEAMFDFAVNYKIDDEKLNRSNSANSKNQRSTDSIGL